MRMMNTTSDQRAARIAASQHGLIAYDQAIAAGLSADQICHRCDSGVWHRVMRGVYAVAGAPAGWRRDALAPCLGARQSGLVSHLTAAALHGWCRPPVLPHVTVPAGASPRVPLAKVHRSATSLLDRVRVDGVPCTSPSRTLVDCAALIERHSLEAMVDDALCAGQAAPESVMAALGRAGVVGRHGAALLQAVVKMWAADIAPESPAEARFLRRLEDWGIDGAVTQHEVRDAVGRVIARIDVALPDRLIGFEYDSDRFHNPRHWERDEHRHAQLGALGWRIEHVSKRDLLPSATRIPDLLARLAA